MDVPTLRVARPTRNIAGLLPFYRDGLGFAVIGSFQDHAGFDGIMLGLPHAPYHLEFTHRRDAQPAGPADSEDLLVLYLPERDEWLAALQRMTSVGFTPVAAVNPYWDRLGRTFEDPDGRRVVLQNARWP